MLTMSLSPQVDLGRAACSLADHHLEARGEVAVGAHDDVEQGLLAAARPVGCRVGLRHRLAEHDQLAGGVAARLQQDRVHRSPPARCRRPAPAPPAPGRSPRRPRVTNELSDMFWALNGATAIALPASHRHIPGSDDGLARVRRRPGDQQRSHSPHTRPRLCALFRPPGVGCRGLRRRSRSRRSELSRGNAGAAR